MGLLIPQVKLQYDYCHGAVVLVVSVTLTQVIKPETNVKGNIKSDIKRHQNQLPQSLNPVTQILTGLKTGKFKAATMLFVYALDFILCLYVT